MKEAENGALLRHMTPKHGLDPAGQGGTCQDCGSTVKQSLARQAARDCAINTTKTLKSQ